MKKKILIGAGILFVLILLIGFGLNLWLNGQKAKPFEATKEELAKLEFYKQPDQWFLDHLQKPRIEIDGQILDPKFQYEFEQKADPTGKEFNTFVRMFSTSLGRKYIRNAVDREWVLYGKITKPMQKTIDLQVKGRAENDIPIRIYVPDNANNEEKLPVLVYAHGGGYLFGSIKTAEPIARLIANEAKMIVVSIDYRLAPEHPYPAASDDGEDIFEWAKNNIKKYNGNSERIAFGGDSAGGHIAINVAQRQLAQNKQAPTILLLYYPATGLPFNDASCQLFGEGFSLSTQFFEYLLTKVFPDQKLETAQPDDYMAPLQAKSLKAMPPSIIATAGFDILRDSGRKFADKLKSDGVQVSYFNYASLPHSFLQYTRIVHDADKATTETAQLLGKQIRALQLAN